MSYHVQPEATEAAYGRLCTDSKVYQPLDTVTVRVFGRGQTDDTCTIRVCDPDQRPYFKKTLSLIDNQGETTFPTGGMLGAHYVYLTWPGNDKYSRYLNFRVECDTAIESGDPDFDDLYPFTRDTLPLGRREYNTPAGKFVGYVSADTMHFDGVWLRDWVYGLPAYRLWERDMACGLDRFLERQDEKGMIPDGIERDGKTWRVGLESDVEYIMTLAVWRTWQTTGDDAWMAATLPKLERALTYIQSDPKHWDAERKLIKRQHSCDTWDFDIDGATDKGVGRHVIATCDQSGYVLAFQAMSDMYAHLGKTDDVKRWSDHANAYRDRANHLLWDGVKFQHHFHIDDIDHADFDETDQLAMGNTWAMTRGLASPDQARSIIDEYRRRHVETGDAYPWWSLQPGYPDHLGYFKGAYRKQGGYANGGLMPWVGGELCRAAFMFGREAYGVELLRAYADHLRRTGGAQVWYWPNGEPGFRTTNEVGYAPWGMGEWIHAATAGLAGICDTESQFNTVTLSPRWAAANVNDVRVRVRYAASNAYFAYRMQIDEQASEIHLTFTGSGQHADIRVLLPAGWQADSAFDIVTEGESRYACVAMPIGEPQTLTIPCTPDQSTDN